MRPCLCFPKEKWTFEGLSISVSSFAVEGEVIFSLSWLKRLSKINEGLVLSGTRLCWASLFHGQNKMLLMHFHPIMGVWPRFAFHLHRRCFISNYFSYFWQLPCWYDSQNGAAFPCVPLAQPINKTRGSPDKINYSISKRWYQLIFCISCQFTCL